MSMGRENSQLQHGGIHLGRVNDKGGVNCCGQFPPNSGNGIIVGVHIALHLVQCGFGLDKVSLGAGLFGRIFGVHNAAAFGVFPALGLCCCEFFRRLRVFLKGFPGQFVNLCLLSAFLRFFPFYS